MTIYIILIAYILGGILTMACIRAWDMTTGGSSDRASIIIGGLIWPAVWICFIIIGVFWCAYKYKVLEWPVEWIARGIYNIIMKLKNKHN